MDTGVAFGLVTVVALVLYLVFSSRTSKPVLRPDEFIELPLAEKTVLTHNSAIYRFLLPKKTDVLGLPIGQHISIGAVIDGKEVVRSYTPISTDEDATGYVDLLIKTYPNGNISKHVSELKLYDTIKVRGPKGFFTYTPNMVKEFAMVAGGTGITPMYQIIKAIARNPADKTKVSLVYANVNEEDILLRKELEEIAAKNDNIKIYYVLNNPPEGWTQGVGFVTPEILKEHIPGPSSDMKLLLCGPPPMVSAIKKAAVGLGYEKAKPVSKLPDQVFVF